MKFFTVNLLRFCIVLIIWTLLFRYALSHFIGTENWLGSTITAVLYGVSIFSFGWIFGKKDYMSFPLYDVGFRFHLMTFIICNLIGVFWLTSGWQSEYESLTQHKWGMIIWAVGLLIHFLIYLYTRRNALEGMNRSDIFE